jgi:Kef-type K+ transport system membrane component KefB
MTTVAYETPHLQTLLTLSSFLFLINIAEALFTYLIRAGLIGPLVIGVVFGPQAANILPEPVHITFITLGYIGLLLLVFEAGLSTNVSLLFTNIFLSVVVALTGILLPIAISIVLLHFGYGYSVLQAFAAGSALCSTSLGTTLALLKPELRQTRTGTVLLSAALLDDIAGLVMAAIIAKISASNQVSSFIPWQIIVRPILVSLGFAFGTPLLAYVVGLLSKTYPLRAKWKYRLHTGPIQFFIIFLVLVGFVASAQYAGTSELFGAYLAGAFLTHIFGSPRPESHFHLETFNDSSPTTRSMSEHDNLVPLKLYIPHTAFTTYLLPSLQTLLSPIFFASMGTALPIRSLGSVDGSHRVVWRGLVYSLFMVLAKATVGAWMLIWPDAEYQRGWCGNGKPSKSKKKNDGGGGKEIGSVNPHPRAASSHSPDSAAATQSDSPSPHVPMIHPNHPDTFTCNPLPHHVNLAPSQPRCPTLSRTRSAFLLGLAMVARGEIALIVAQLARPLLVGSSSTTQTSEPFAVVIWAILVTTVGGAVAVGWLLKT